MAEEKNRVRTALDAASKYFHAKPDEARQSDPPARAKVTDGVRCRVDVPGGGTLVTDMPRAMGGQGTAPAPDWFMRAAIAACGATTIAMGAAHSAIEFSEIEVTVRSDSDRRGHLGVDNAPIAPLAVRMEVTLHGASVSPEQLADLVAWAETKSPVTRALRDGTPVKLVAVPEGERRDAA